MANLSKNELFERIVEAVNASGWNVLHDPGMSSHPFKIRIYRGNENRRLKIYIWNISHGGGYMRPPDEYRIQVKVDHFEPEPGWTLLILGWWDDGRVFAGFDYRKHTGHIGWSASFQIKLEALESAAQNGFAPSDKGNREIAIAFRPELLVEYASNVNAFHSFGESRPDLQVLETIAADPQQLANEEVIERVSRPRQRALTLVSRAIRDYSFKTRILRAYAHTCAFCDIQLDLIQAAHIVPVTHEASTDETRNGVALCALHHQAYDDALVTFDSSYRIISSEDKLRVLRQIQHDGEMQRFVNELRPSIIKPTDNHNWPHGPYIAKANRLRGWSI